MIKAIIFDLDGVIVSTDSYHYQAWKAIADKEGIYFDSEINNRLRGVSRLESLEIILEQSIKRYSKQEKEELMELKNDMYLRLLNQLSVQDILPGVMELIEFLKTENYKIAIGSSSRNAKKILQQIKLINVFDAIADGNDVIRSKPHPDVFLKAAEMLNITPENCGVVEDAIAGIKAANAANMLSIAIYDAKNFHEADLKINELKEIINFLKIK